MCGRYTLVSDPRELADEFELDGPATVTPRYNIAPTQNVPIVRFSDLAAGDSMAVVRVAESGGKRSMDILRWGLSASVGATTNSA